MHAVGRGHRSHVLIAQARDFVLGVGEGESELGEIGGSVRG